MDMLAVRDELIDGIDTEQLYSVDQVTHYVDQGITGVLTVLADHLPPWEKAVGACQVYFDKINN